MERDHKILFLVGILVLVAVCLFSWNRTEISREQNRLASQSVARAESLAIELCNAEIRIGGQLRLAQAITESLDGHVFEDTIPSLWAEPESTAVGTMGVMIDLADW